jgi:hypothetical protein
MQSVLGFLTRLLHLNQAVAAAAALSADNKKESNSPLMPILILRYTLTAVSLTSFDNRVGQAESFYIDKYSQPTMHVFLLRPSSV